MRQRARKDLDILDYPRDEWVLPRAHATGQHVYDVIILGGGVCGLSAAFGLLKERVKNILVLDRAPKGQEGPWTTYSRMWTLRSPKHITGPDLGVPSLTPRSWFEAAFGEQGWEELGKWPRQLWQSYLEWYRETLDLPVRNDCEVTGFEHEGSLVRLSVRGGNDLFARKVILATGLEGMGDWYVPPIVRELPKQHWTLCSDNVDSLSWRGKSIAVLGAGATAWDRAADLLELGAKSVTIYMRRRHILVSSPFRYLEKAGFRRHYASMTDAEKWRWVQTLSTFGQPPTQDGVDRCAAFENFTLHANAGWTGVTTTRTGIEITASDGSNETFDHLFIGCGFSMDAHGRPELAGLADNILTWGDVYEPPAGQEDRFLKGFPYLNADLSFIEKAPGETPVLRNIYCFNFGATVTNGYTAASLANLRYGLEPLIHGITLALWQEDEPQHYHIAKHWDGIETDASPLVARMWRRP